MSNPVSRFWQKQKIKRDYAKAARAAGQTAQGAAGAATKTAQASAAAAKKAAQKSEKAASFVARHWKGALLIGGVGLLLLMIMGGLQSCTAMFGGTGTGLAATWACGYVLSVRGRGYAGSRSRLRGVGGRLAA